MWHNLWLAKPYGLANQKLCYIQIYTVLDEKTKNALESGWWIRTQDKIIYTVKTTLLA